uniref:Microphthalmia-associated transcription factor n=1 Tax=Heterorhabditis bacteriophora TaxID=37862 RepID=A0A1I7XMX1_HETBA
MEERKAERKRYLEGPENTYAVKRPRSEEPTSSAPQSINHDKLTINGISSAHNFALKPYGTSEIDSSSSQNIMSIHRMPAMPVIQNLAHSTSLNRSRMFEIAPFICATDTANFAHEELIKGKIAEPKVPALAAAPSIIPNQNSLVNTQSGQTYNLPLTISQDVLQRQHTEQIFMKSQDLPLPKAQKVELQQKGEILQNLQAQRERYLLKQRNKYQEILQHQQQQQKQQQHQQQQRGVTTNQQHEIKATEQIQSIYGNQFTIQQISEILKNPALADPMLMPKIIANLTQQSQPRITPTMLSPQQKQSANNLPSAQASAAHIALDAIMHGTVPYPLTQLQAQRILLNSANQMQQISSNSMSQNTVKTVTTIPPVQQPVTNSLMALPMPTPQQIEAALSIINANAKPFQPQIHTSPIHIEVCY